MRAQPLVLVPEAYYLKRAASLWLRKSWSDTTVSRPPSASNLVNHEDNACLKPTFCDSAGATDEIALLGLTPS